MVEITEATSIKELAVIISEAVEAAGDHRHVVGRWGGIDLQQEPVHES